MSIYFNYLWVKEIHRVMKTSISLTLCVDAAIYHLPRNHLYTAPYPQYDSDTSCCVQFTDVGIRVRIMMLIICSTLPCLTLQSNHSFLNTIYLQLCGCNDCRDVDADYNYCYYPKLLIE